MLWVISDDTHEFVGKLWRDFEHIVTPQNEPFEAEAAFENHKQWVDDFNNIGRKRKGYGVSGKNGKLYLSDWGST